jgi:hypothetical protein
MDGRQLVKRIKSALVFAKDDGKHGQILGEAAFHQGVLLRSPSN